MMYVARILYPVRVLGPGERIGIWFAGCNHHCEGCSNPELWEKKAEYLVDINVLTEMIRKIAGEHAVDGFTLTGGDPFLQPEALAELLPVLRMFSEDILVYTGYVYEELKKQYPHILAQIAVLIDGPYIEQRNNNCPLRGSDNQRLIYCDTRFNEKYTTYLTNYTNQIQNFRARDGVISVGIHRPGYNEEFKERLRKKGVLTDE